jgi:hypothetical protein
MGTKENGLSDFCLCLEEVRGLDEVRVCTMPMCGQDHLPIGEICPSLVIFTSKLRMNGAVTSKICGTYAAGLGIHQIMCQRRRIALWAPNIWERDFEVRIGLLSEKLACNAASQLQLLSLTSPFSTTRFDSRVCKYKPQSSSIYVLYNFWHLKK